jgi:hypothetical protein
MTHVNYDLYSWKLGQQKINLSEKMLASQISLNNYYLKI